MSKFFKFLRKLFNSTLLIVRLCMKSLETKVRQGENSRGTAGVALDVYGL